MKCKRRAALLLAGAMLCAGLLFGCGAKEESEELKTYPYDAGEFFTNIRDSKMMLSCAIKMDLTSEKLSAELVEKDYIVKDVIGTRLRQITEEDLAREDFVSELADSLVEQLNEALESRHFYRVYFIRFVYQ
ncbi:MAG: flagellar basal body-associated FliL family protein [Oscillospiraceae bacterium]|jgi:flagellar FliL protein|nr:flagellar basal body-associated FliL family protein [Oscillospiraceae bacterium]